MLPIPPLVRRRSPEAVIASHNQRGINGTISIKTCLTPSSYATPETLLSAHSSLGKRQRNTRPSCRWKTFSDTASLQLLYVWASSPLVWLIVSRAKKSAGFCRANSRYLMTSAGETLLIHFSSLSVLRFLSRFTSTVINTGLRALAFDNDADIASFRKDKSSHKSG